MTICLGIDQSYSGLAMVAYNGATGEHSERLASFPAENYENQSVRLGAIRAAIGRNLHWFTMTFGTVDVVAMEGYATGAKFGRELSGELGGTVKLALTDNLRNPQCWPIIVAPSKLKKFTTGKGGAAKSEMLLAVYKKWGVEYSDDNLADAYSLARAAHTWYSKTGTKAELDALKGLKRFASDTHNL